MVSLRSRSSADPALSASIERLIGRFTEHHADGVTDVIRRAGAAAIKAHEGQLRRTGEPYVTHPIAVADIAADLGLDEATITAALLHDAVEDTGITKEWVAQEFGDQVAAVVDGVTKLDRLEFDSKEEQQAATIRKMFIAMAQDWRVLLIKLADRLHNMRTISVMPMARQRAIAQETLDVYAPLAHRAVSSRSSGSWRTSGTATLHPKRYAEIEQMVAARQPEREDYLDEVKATLSGKLDEFGIKAEVHGRPKHLWSIYEKMVIGGKEFDDIYDLVGLRVIVDEDRDCWAVIGAIHALWSPFPGVSRTTSTPRSSTCTSHCTRRSSAHGASRSKCRSGPSRCTDAPSSASCAPGVTKRARRTRSPGCSASPTSNRRRTTRSRSSRR